MAAWDLSVIVEDLGADAPPITISVTSDLHIGGVILKLVEKMRESASFITFTHCCFRSLSADLRITWKGELEHFIWRARGGQKILGG